MTTNQEMREGEAELDRIARTVGRIAAEAEWETGEAMARLRPAELTPQQVRHQHRQRDRRMEQRGIRPGQDPRRRR